MFHTVYLIWAILPLLLLGLAGWAVMKPVFGVPGKEDSRDYFKQALFCVVAFAIAVLIDRTFLNTILLNVVDEGDDTATIAHWLLYPLVLLLMAQGNRLVLFFQGKDRNKDLNYGLARYKR